jgi:hypothetical protein
VFISAAAHLYVKSFSYPLGLTYRIIEPFQSKIKEVNGNVYVESGFSEKLQTMQIIRANHLHVEKESWKEIFRRQ